MTYEAASLAAHAIRSETGRETHQIAVVLGSGLSSYAAAQPGAVEVPYQVIPAFPVPKVAGHAGSLFSVEIGGVTALLFAGRVHAYEGWEMAEVVFGVRAAILAGASTVVLTNAAGGVGEGLAAGDLVLIRDHLNLTGRNPLVGANDERFGTRFPDMTDAYSVDLRASARETAAGVGVELKEGVYAWFLGPTYETPAEVEMAKRLGADLVGMSTVPETIAARHMGARVLAISLVTNLAAGISPTPLSHDEVKEAADTARGKFTALLDAVIRTLG